MTPEQMVTMYRKREAALDNEFSQLRPIFTDIRDFLAPRTARFEGEQIHDGKRQDLNIINTNPRFAVRTLPAGMQSGVTSPLRPWFRLGIADTDLMKFEPVKLWLNEVERILREVMTRSNLYDRLKSSYGILGTYGTSALFIEEDPEDLVRGYDLLMGSFRLATDARGRVNTLYRHTQLTCRQMKERAERRGWKLPDQVKVAWDSSNYEQYFDLLHIVERNANYRANSLRPQDKLYVSVWLFKAAGNTSDAILSLKGYDDLPMMCPRWDIVGEDVYGMGCGEVALGDAKQLQLMEKRKLQGIDKNVNPPMIADASMRNKRVSNLPGDTTYVNGLISGKPGYAPAYQVNPALNELRTEIEAVEQRIDEAFYKDLFRMVVDMVDQKNITATQINASREEKMLMLGPVLERLNDELLDPLIDRVFNIATRFGRIPPAPPELQGQPLKVEYISVLAQAQKAIGNANIERYIGFVGQTAQFFPEALDKVDIDAAIEEYAEGVAVPPQIVRSEDEANQIREARAKQQAQQIQAQQAAAAVESAKTLSEADLETDNALRRAVDAYSNQQQAAQ